VTFLMALENVFYENLNLFPQKKCPCWQETNVTFYHTDPCGEVKYFAKNSLTAMPVTLPLVQTGCPLLGDVHTKCH
jgi:hypothetical protein